MIITTITTRDCNLMMKAVSLGIIVVAVAIGRESNIIRKNIGSKNYWDGKRYCWKK
jgi:hypothetical protein